MLLFLELVWSQTFGRSLNSSDRWICGRLTTLMSAVLFAPGYTSAITRALTRVKTFIWNIGVLEDSWWTYSPLTGPPRCWSNWPLFFWIIFFRALIFANLNNLLTITHYFSISPYRIKILLFVLLRDIEISLDSDVRIEKRIKWASYFQIIFHFFTIQQKLSQSRF